MTTEIDNRPNRRQWWRRKRTWIPAAVVIVGTAAGCGSSDQPDSETEAAAPPTTQTAAPTTAAPTTQPPTPTTTEDTTSAAIADVCADLQAPGLTIAAGKRELVAGLETIRDRTSLRGTAIGDALAESQCSSEYSLLMATEGLGPWVADIDHRVTSCNVGNDGRGELVIDITNDLSFAVDITIAWEYGTPAQRQADGLAFVSRLAPGQSTVVTERVFDAQNSAGNCTVKVSRLTPA